MDTNQGGLSELLPERIQTSYLAKMVAVFVVIGLVVASVGAYSYVDTSQRVKAETQQELVANAEIQAAQLSTWLEEHYHVARLVSGGSALVGDTAAAEKSAYLTAERERLPAGVVSLHYIDRETTNVIASSERGDVGTPLFAGGVDTSIGSFEFADAHAVQNTPIYQQDGVNVLTFFSPTTDDADRLVAMTVETDGLTSLLQTPVEGSYTQVVSKEGVILFDGNAERFLQPYAQSDSAALRSALDGDSGVLEQGAVEGIMDERHVVAYAPAGGDRAILVHAPTASAYALQQEVAGDLAILILLSLLGFGVIGAVLHRNTVTPLGTLAEKVRALREGDLDVDLRTGRKDEFGSVLRGVAKLRDDLRDQRHDAERYGAVMSVAADGDLSARMDADSDSRDMRTIATSYNGMMDEIEGTVLAVRQFSDDVASLSEEVAASADEVSRASSEVSTSIQHIADGAVDQNDSLLAVSEEIDAMTASVEQIAASADELADYTKRTTAKGDEGRQAANEALTGIETIREETEHTVSEMEQLDEQMAEIGDIVEVISDIAEQTNILALNANIEAARAGEAGSGFAVVSNEVKSLAEETQDSAQRIEERIASLQRQQQSVLDGMDRMRTRVEEGTESVGTAIGSFEEIVEELDETNASVEEINAATSRQAESSQDILTMTEEATSISEETTAEAQTVSAAAEEQTATLSEVSEGVHRLAENASELKTRLEQFEVRDERGPPESSADFDADSTAAAPVSRPTATDGGANAR